MPRGLRLGAVAPVSIATFERESWKLQAACSAEPEPFTREVWQPEALKCAQAICQACPVMPECAALADSTQQPWGIWAGIEWHSVRRSEKGSPIGGATR